ncbi:hypothetical protein AX16_009850 [Volvariella volvacea WC 439]|nr:hypothetical protein AX16_009850 [Volvariella volvacea WC 439]
MHTNLTPLAVPDIKQYLQLLCTSPSTNNSILLQSTKLNHYTSFSTTIPPHSSFPINTHIAIAIPTGHYGHVAPRSSLTFKSGVTTFGGTIDADYHGELKVLLRNDSDQEFKVRVGDCITQLIIELYIKVTPTQATTLGSTVRGTSGFGFTGLSSLSNPMPTSSFTIRYLPADMRNSTSFSTYIKNDSKEFPAKILIDNKATISLVLKEFIKANGLKINKTSTTTLLRNTDGSLNSCITHSLSFSLFLDG